MTEGEKRLKKKLRRTETIGFRLEPKLRFAAELAARKQRRSLSSFIEWAVEETIRNVHLNGPETAYNAMENAWDVDEADRFAKLGLLYPFLLTHDEEVLWKLICENGLIWKGRYVLGTWTWKICADSLIFKRLRENWETFQQVANGDLGKDQLPTWIEKKEAEEDEEDDIPF